MNGLLSLKQILFCRKNNKKIETVKEKRIFVQVYQLFLSLLAVPFTVCLHLATLDDGMC